MSLSLCATAAFAAQPRTIEDIINTQISYPSPSSINTGTDADAVASTAQDTIDNLHNTGALATDASDRQSHSAAAATSADNPRAFAATPPASPMTAPYGLALDESGNLYVTDGGANAIWKITGDGKIALLAGASNGASGSTNGKGTSARFNGPGNIAIRAGTLYVTDFGNNDIRTISPDGTVRTLAGSPTATAYYSEGNGANAAFYYPLGIAVDNSGKLYVADSGNGVIRAITSAGATSWLSGETYSHSYTISGAGAIVRSSYTIDSGLLAITGTLNFSSNFATTSTLNFASSGAILTCDGGNLTAVSGSALNALSGTTLSGTYALDNINTVNLGDGYFFNGGALLYNTGSDFLLLSGSYALIDTGTLSIADLTFADSGTTQPPTLSGTHAPQESPMVTSSPPQALADAESYAPDAYSFWFLGGMALSPDGNYLYACTGAPAISAIKISDGTITPLDTTLFGDAADSLRPASPANLRFDAQGNLYIADTGNSRILKVSLADGSGAVTRLAGGGTPDADGNYESGYKDGPGATALFDAPTDIAIDNSGNIYVADNGNGVIRKIDTGNNVTTLALEEVSLASINGNADSGEGGGGGGGGGALSPWYLLALASLVVARLRRR